MRSMLGDSFDQEYGHRLKFRKTFLETYVCGSAFWATRYDFALLWLACLGWTLLFGFVVEDEDNVDDPFGFGTLTFTVLFFQATFSGVLYVEVERQLFVDIVLEYDIIHSALLGMAIDASTLLQSARAANSQVNALVEELDRIIRSASLAFIDEHRHADNESYATPSIAAPWTSSVGSSIQLDNRVRCIERLYLTPELQRELEAYSESTSEMLMHMAMARVAALVEQGTISDRIWHRFSQTKERILEQSFRIKANRRIGITRVLKSIAIVSIYVWCFFIPWFLWPDFRYNTLWIYAFVAWPIIALLGAGRILEDPFTEYTQSNYSFMDLRLLALETARWTRNVFSGYTKPKLKL